MRRVLSFLAVAAVLAAVPAAAQAAAPTVIDFNGVAAGQSIDDEFGGQGVFFGQPSTFQLPNPPGRLCGQPPVGRTAGIAGGSIAIDCKSPGEIDAPRQFSVAMEFATERRDVRFDLQQRTTGPAVVAKIRAYNVTGAQLSEQQVTLFGNAVNVAVTRAATEIAYIVVFGELNVNEQTKGDILIDNLVAQLDDVPPPPKFRLVLETPTIGVFEGSTGTATISIRRFNGSTGPVTLSAGALPPGIRSTQFDPAAPSGRNPVAFRIRADNPASGQVQLVVDATGGGAAGTNAGTALIQTVNLLPAVVQFGRGTPETLVAGCGTQTFQTEIEVRGEYFGTVDFRPTPSGGLVVNASPENLFVTGAGRYPYTLSVDPFASTGGTQTVTLNAVPRTATAASATIPFTVTPFKVPTVPTLPVLRPRLGRTAQMTVLGQFPTACTVRFRDTLGQTWTTVRQTGDTAILDVPANAVPGPLQVVGANGRVLATTAPIDVVDFRMLYGSGVVNSDAGARTPDYTWDDFVETFGKDDAYTCWVPRGLVPSVFESFTCVRDPIAFGHFLVFQGRVEDTPGKGLCSGWSTMARRWSEGYYGFRNRAWTTDYSDGTAFKHSVVRYHVAQHDDDFQDALDAGFDRSAAEERAYIKGAIDGPRRSATVSFRQGDSGHQVVAYDYQEFTAPGGGTGIRLALYDPNDPYDAGEATNLTVRNDALNTESTMTIQPDGSWSGSSLGWSGPNDKLSVTTSLPPDDATLPLSLNIASFFDTAAGAPPAKVTSLKAGGKNVLGPDGEPLGGSGVKLRPDLSGAGAQPEWHLDKGRAYTFGITGTGTGTYGHGVLGDDVRAQVVGARTAPGQVDEVTVRPGQAQIGFRSASGGSVQLDLAAKSGKTTRTATVAVRSGAKGNDEAELSGGTVRLRHTGRSTSASVTLGSVGGGVPATAKTAAIRVGSGQSIELRPKSWSSLTGSVRLVVRNKRGRVVRRTTVKLRSTGSVALSGVKAKRSGRRVTVTGRVSKRGTTPALSAVVEQVRGGRVVSTKTAGLQGAKVRRGRFSLRVNVGTVRRGTKLRVTTLLLDTAKELSTSVKRVQIR